MMPAERSTSEASVWTEPRTRLSDGKALTLMDHLFNRLDGLYPGRWRANYPSPEAIKSWNDAWLEAFVEEGLDPAEVRPGIANCRRAYAWPPSCTEFLRACRPYLDPEVAYRLAVSGMTDRAKGNIGEWPHPAIYWAAVRIGQHDMLQASWQAVKTRWENTLSAELARGRWDAVPEPAFSLPAPGATVSTNQEGIKHIEAISTEALQTRRRNPRAWAQRVLSNPSRYCSFAERAAREVAGIDAEAPPQPAQTQTRES